MTEGASRRRDSSATRRALLAAARELFASKGFQRTTVRDIAALAGVNQALLFRYFGSKEELLGAVLAGPGTDLLAGVAPEQLLGELLTQLFDDDRGSDQSALLMLALTGPGAAADTLRREVSEPFAAALATLTDAPDARLRAELVLAWALGLAVARAANPDGALTGTGVAGDLVLRAARTLLERAG